MPKTEKKPRGKMVGIIAHVEDEIKQTNKTKKPIKKEINASKVQKAQVKIT
jgi:hypothetical protein